MEDGRISNAVWWQLMVDADGAVWFRKERNGIGLLLVLGKIETELGCMRLDVCEEAQLCCCPCRTS
jgi:hypothetical protein